MPTPVLLHGLWMGRPATPYLDKRLRAAGYRQVHSSHTGLVFSSEVADLAHTFLAQGHF